MAGLTLRFELDDSGEPKLLVELDIAGFRGETEWWGSPSEFSVFVRDLSAYPIKSAAPVVGEWPGSLKLQIEPFDTKGALEVTAAIVANLEPRNRCEVVFRSHYADIDRFRDQLEVGISTGTGEATLACS